MDESHLMQRETDMMREQMSNDPGSIYADGLREEKVNNILGQINPEKLVIDIENRIRGYKKDPTTGEWVAITDAKQVSEELVADVVSYLGAFLNDTQTLSNYSEREINNIMEKIIDYFKDALPDNDIKYGLVDDYHEMTRIADIVCAEIFATLKRALHGMESRRIFSALRVTESLNQSPQKKSGLSALQFWK